MAPAFSSPAKRFRLGCRCLGWSRIVIEASCHCGAVKMQVVERPESITSCNCSLCHRNGARLAYHVQAQVVFAAGKARTVAYVQGDRTLETHHCPTCGCVTHWESVRKGAAERIAVNTRLMDPADIAGVRVRHLDGADTWTYTD
jgi:hypothetical protein